MQESKETCPICYVDQGKNDTWHDIHQCKHRCCNQCMPKLLDKTCPMCRALPQTRYIFRSIDDNYIPNDTFIILEHKILKIETKELRSRMIYTVSKIGASQIPEGEGFLVTEVDDNWVFVLTRDLKSAFNRMTRNNSWPE